MRGLSFIILFLWGTSIFAQNNSVRYIDSALYANKIDELRSEYGVNKSYPKQYELQILTSLSLCPELKECNITFKEQKIKTTLNARPTVGSLLFKGKKHRNYVVRINNSLEDSIITLNEVPFNAMIGLLSHEFSHFVDYMNKNIFQMAQLGSYYIFCPTSEARYEKSTDELTIKRGMGWQLYDWSYFVLYQSDASVEYKEFKRKTYLQPEEIEQLIEKQ